MHHLIIRVLTPIFIGLFLVVLVFVAATVEADESGGSIDLNGLYWGDGDYLDYNFKSQTETDDRGFLYVNQAGPGQLYVLVRVGWMGNDNAFSLNKPNQDPYLASVGWQNPHDLGRLIGSDHLELWLECGTGEPAPRWTWIQDLLYDADLGPGYDWRSDFTGPDGAPVTSPTGDDIPPSGIVITSYSSLEYNMKNSSWIFSQQAIYPNNPVQWMSPDLDPLGTISTTSPMTDVNAITGIHEDYPFFVSTGSSPSDLFEWEISYEMLLDVSHCGEDSIFIGVSSAHNSPPKEGPEDIVIPTAIRLTSASAKAGGSDLTPIMLGSATFLLVSATVVLIFLRRSRATRQELL